MEEEQEAQRTTPVAAHLGIMKREVIAIKEVAVITEMETEEIAEALTNVDHREVM